MQHFTQFKAIATLVLGIATSAVLAQSASTYPNKPVNIMVPYPAGGLSDIIARIVQPPFSKNIGQQAVIENLGGASGAIALQKVLDAPADGYYIFQGSPNEVILAPLANKAVKYKPTDLTAVQLVSYAPMAIIARNGLNVNTADELVVRAREAARAGKPLTYASVGIGSFYHLLGEDMSQKINAPMVHVPYKGAADVVKDLVGDQVDIFISPYGKPHVAMAEQGRFKFIAALSKNRQPLLPKVPSITEGVGLKTFLPEIWSGYFVKKGTPQAVIDKIRAAVNTTVQEPQMRMTLEGQNQLLAKPMTQAENDKFFLAQIKHFGDIAKSIGLQPQ